MATQKKIDTVSLLADKISRAKAMVFVDYRGLKHKQMEELRKTLRKLKGEFIIAKNRLMMRALGKEVILSDTTATLFSYDDEISPLKELLKYFKTAGVGKTKGGILGSQILTDAEVTRLAALPTRTALLGQLVGQLNAPIQGLHYALQWNLKKLVYVLNVVKAPPAHKATAGGGGV